MASPYERGKVLHKCGTSKHTAQSSCSNLWVIGFTGCFYQCEKEQAPEQINTVATKVPDQPLMKVTGRQSWLKIRPSANCSDI